MGSALVPQALLGRGLLDAALANINEHHKGMKKPRNCKDNEHHKGMKKPRNCKDADLAHNLQQL